MGIQKSKHELAAAATDLEKTEQSAGRVRDDFTACTTRLSKQKEITDMMVPALLTGAAEDYEKATASLSRVIKIYKEKALPHLEASGLADAGPEGRGLAATVHEFGSRLNGAMQLAMDDIFQEGIFTDPVEALTDFTNAADGVRENLHSTLLADNAILPRMIGMLSTFRTAVEAYNSNLSE